MSNFIIFPHQLFENITNLQASKKIYLLEHPIFFGYRQTKMNFNKKKLIMHRASMKCYEQYLKENTSAIIIYINFNELLNSDICKIIKHPKETISYYKPIDYLLEEKLTNINTTTTLEPLNFLTSDKEFEKYYETVKSKKKPFYQTGFYKWQRERLQILMKNGKPFGGKLTYDNDNRNPLPKNIKIPQIIIPKWNKYIKEAIDYIEKNFPNNIGESDNFWCPINFKDAKLWFKYFLKDRLHNFGTYQDAITEKNDIFIFHSGISCALNIGILDPYYIIIQAIKYGEEHKIGINNIEGFIRQILGWREFSRFTYKYIYKEMTTINYFNAKYKMSSSFYNGKTGLLPLDVTIQKAFKNGYLHHIERLMIVGSLTMMMGIHPNDVYKWFMEFSVDSYDWVMINNVYSMALYSDGGLTTTKAYAASSNYEMIRKSDFKKGIWQEIWDSLYWSFIGNNLDKMKKMGRFGPIQAKNWLNKTKEQKEKFKKISEKFININIL